MTYPFENRMAVEGQRLYEERYGPLEDDDDDVITYCDIYHCSECPRYGDDCDGEWEDEYEAEE